MILTGSQFDHRGDDSLSILAPQNDRSVGHRRKVTMLRDAVYLHQKVSFWRTCAISLQHLCSKAPIKFSIPHSPHEHLQTKECQIEQNHHQATISNKL